MEGVWDGCEPKSEPKTETAVKGGRAADQLLEGNKTRHNDRRGDEAEVALGGLGTTKNERTRRRASFVVDFYAAEAGGRQRHIHDAATSEHVLLL